MVTSRNRSVTSAGSGWPQGRSLVVQVSGGALTRTSSVAPSSKDKSQSFGEIGSTQFLERGFGPALFFVVIPGRECSDKIDYVNFVAERASPESITPAFA